MGVQIGVYAPMIDKTLIKQHQNCLRIAITFPKGFLLYMHVENCLPALFYIICGYTAEHSFAPIILSNVSLYDFPFLLW